MYVWVSNLNTESNPNLPSNPTVDTKATGGAGDTKSTEDTLADTLGFAPKSKEELQDAVTTCGDDSMKE